MDKDRFNALLSNVNEITNDDLKALNQIRREYPCFQSQYVLIAKALKDRKHPKADAFVKKAAIYTADRARLKAILNNEVDLSVTVVVPEPPVEVVEVTEATASAQETTEKETTPDVVAPVEEEVVKPTEKEPVPEPTSPTEPEPVATATEPEVETATPNTAHVPESATEAPTETPAPEKETKVISLNPKQEQPNTEEAPANKPSAQDDALTELQRDLEEIRKKKQLLAKLLDQNEAKQAKKNKASYRSDAQKKSPKAERRSQSELIEKFIRDAPQMDKQKLVVPENTSGQEDLAAINIKDSNEFYTETLAKLMIKQKKYGKARAIYEALQLKFPEKSAYFASQIENLIK